MSLSEADISRMRTVAETALPGTAVIQTESFTDDGGGGGTVAWTAAGTVSCRIAPLSGSEREIADRVAEDATAMLTLPAETAITESDRVITGGETFNVLYVHDRGTWEITRRVEVGKQV